MMSLTGYTDRFSLRAGESVGVKVSSAHAQDFEADLVRLYGADPNPAGPGRDIEPVHACFEGSYPSVAKIVQRGSYGVVDLERLGPLTEATLALRFQPRLLTNALQTLVSGQGPVDFALSVTEAGVVVTLRGINTLVPVTMSAMHWYDLRFSPAGGVISIYEVASGDRLGHVRVSEKVDRVTRLTFAAHSRDGDNLDQFFNGRIEDPRLVKGGALPITIEDGSETASVGSVLAWWDFSQNIDNDRISDVGPLGLDGVLMNLPTRGVRGSRWTGDEMVWRHAPREYAAVEFHEDDLYDCAWPTDFVATIPADTPSGVYGIRLRCGQDEDIIPIFVRPATSAPRAKVAVIFSTFTYLAYSNYKRTNYDDAYRRRQKEWSSNPNHPAAHPEYGLSTYDRHLCGSGVFHSSMRRPQLLMRPDLFAYFDQNGSGLRHFPADLHLVAWFKAMEIDFDVVTDHDLDAEGIDAIAGYDIVMTVTHPEYQTLSSWNAVGDYINSGGCFAYLGGNGFYWRIATCPGWPDAIELRRGESGVRMWQVEPGEQFHAFDGRYGGLWLKNDRPPQRLVGVGMTAQGAFNGSYYRRTEASYHEDAAWIFDGLTGDVLGDHGLSGGGAAGFELDCADPALGTHPDTVILARSEGHSADYACVGEKVFDPDDHTPEWQAKQIHADMTVNRHPMLTPFRRPRLTPLERSWPGVA